MKVRESDIRNQEIDVELLEQLTEELTKEKPQVEKLKSYMKLAGLKYSEDPIERINLVLNKLNFFAEEES